MEKQGDKIVDQVGTKIVVISSDALNMGAWLRVRWAFNGWQDSNVGTIREVIVWALWGNRDEIS
jgi:hypothetical protein